MSIILGFSNQHLPAFNNNWRRFLASGITLIILGALAISAATFATLVSVVVLGFLVFLGGIIMMADTFTFWRRKGSGFFLHLFFSLLYLAVGATLVINPVQGSISLTLLLGIFYIVVGAFRTALAPTLRTPQWGWAWFNGLITLLLGILIITSWPGSSLFIIGLFVGIDLVFCGLAYVMAALSARRSMA